MKITDYAFGSITVDGETYTKDVIIFPNHVFSPWWRKEGHLLQIPDLADIMGVKLPVLIVGTGYYGAMRVPEEILDYLRSNNIKTHVEKTTEAVKLYNKISAKSTAIAALHLTC
jgi:hypothetical protein